MATEPPHRSDGVRSEYVHVPVVSDDPQHAPSQGSKCSVTISDRAGRSTGPRTPCTRNMIPPRATMATSRYPRKGPNASPMSAQKQRDGGHHCRDFLSSTFGVEKSPWLSESSGPGPKRTQKVFPVLGPIRPLDRKELTVKGGFEAILPEDKKAEGLDFLQLSPRERAQLEAMGTTTLEQLATCNRSRLGELHLRHEGQYVGVLADLRGRDCPLLRLHQLPRERGGPLRLPLPEILLLRGVVEAPQRRPRTGRLEDRSGEGAVAAPQRAGPVTLT